MSSLYSHAQSSSEAASAEILAAMFDGHSVSESEENEPKAKLGIDEFIADEDDEVTQFAGVSFKSNEADREGVDGSKIFATYS